MTANLALDADICKIKLYKLYLNCKSILYDIIELIYGSGNDFDLITILGIQYDKLCINDSTVVNEIQYFSYREKFPVLLSNGLNNDIGWGCMIRTGQMMLCETFKHLKGAIRTPRSGATINSLFCDDPSADFSIHKILEIGLKNNMVAGKFVSPTSLVMTLKDTVSASAYTNTTLEIVHARDGTIYRDEIMKIFTSQKKCLLLVPIMLGETTINQKYCMTVLRYLDHPTTMGIIGGIGQQSLYLIGTGNGEVIYLDPHMVKNAYIDPQQDNDERRKIGKTKVYNLNPSMIMCFMFDSYCQFEDWEEDVTRYNNNIEKSESVLRNGDSGHDGYNNDDKMYRQIFSITDSEKTYEYSGKEMKMEDGWIFA